MRSSIVEEYGVFERLKSLLSVEGFLCLSFAAFMAGFYLSPAWKAMNIFFYFLVAIPFLIFRGKALYYEVIKNPAVLFGNFFILYLTLSHFWVVGDPVFRTSKVLGMGLCTLLFFNISYYAIRQNYQRVFVPLVIVSAGIMVISSLIIFYGDNPFPTARLRSVINEMHPIWVAQLLGVALLLMLGEVTNQNHALWKLLCISLAVISVVGILLTHSRSVLISLPVTLMLVMLVYGVRFSVFMLVIGSACVFAYWYMDNEVFNKLMARGLAGRDAIWTQQIERLDGNWLFGLGLSANDDVQFSSFRALHTHSIYVGVVYFGGIVGAALLLTFVGLAIGKAISIAEIRQHWLPYSMVLFGLVSFIVEGEKLVRLVGTEWFLFWFPIAYLLAVKKEENSEEADRNLAIE